MAQVADVAKYILATRTAQKRSTTAYALQKILYYCQAWMLVAQGRKLFDNDIEAWDQGPVVPEVFRRYCRGRHFVFPSEIPGADPERLALDERMLIDSILDLYKDDEGDHLGDFLAENSHQEEPWIKARQSDKKNEVITAESMLDYYSLIQADPSLHPQTKVPNLSDVSTRTFISEEEAEWIKTLLKREA